MSTRYDIGTRVRDAIAFRIYGTTELGTVENTSGDDRVWVRWDGYENADDLCHIEDLTLLAKETLR